MRKIIHTVLVLFLFFMLFGVNVYAAKNPYKKTSSFGTNCTWYAWQQAYEKGGVALPGWSNAKNWIKDAKKAGYETGSTPKSNSIIVWDEWTDYGHLGYVEKYQDGYLYVWDSASRCQEPVTDEQQAAFDKCHDEIYWANGGDQYADGLANSKCLYLVTNPEIGCKLTMEGDKVDYSHVAGFIYLDSAPKTTTTKKKTTTTKSTTISTSTTTTEKVISSNAYLSSLTIDKINFNFDKDILEYNLEVENEVTEILINAEALDSNSTVEAVGEKILSEGISRFNIVVRAEDLSEKVYVLNITRKEINTTSHIKEEAKKLDKEEKKNNQNTKVLLIIVILIIVIIIIGVIILKYKKKRK